MPEIIKFINTWGELTTDLFPPEPAYKNVPQWYKDLNSYLGEEKKPSGDGKTTATIKRCMPVFDVINLGYILKSPADIFVSQIEVKDDNGVVLGKSPYYEWAHFDLLSFHPVSQAVTHPYRKSLTEYSTFPKWENPWAIITPPGYSCLFVAPFHKESVFEIMPGIVDTDNYHNAVNFPFVLKDWSFEGIIPAGTEIAQVIPFKRDNFQMEISDKEEDLITLKKQWMRLRSRFFDSYKSQWRVTKSYK